jgi:type I restriction-modification system DNA methylase subunit
MPPAPNKQNDKNGNGQGHLGFEATLWATADKLRGNLDAAEYKHVVLGLIFLKYISDAFEEKHTALQEEKDAGPQPTAKFENIYDAEHGDNLLALIQKLCGRPT